MLNTKYLKILEHKDILKNYFISGINIFLVILALNLLSINLGIYDSSFMLICTIFVITGLILFNIRFKKLYNLIRNRKNNKKNLKTNLITGIILIIFPFTLLIFSKNQMLWFVSFPIFLFGLQLTIQTIGSNRKELYILSVTSFVYTLFFILLQRIPALWNIIREISFIFSRSIGSLINRPMLLGPSVSGLWIVIIFIIFSFCVFFISGIKKRYFLLNLIGLLLCWIIYIIILGFTEYKSNIEVVNLHYVLFIICLIPTILFFIKTKLKDLSLNLPSINKKKIKKLIINTSFWAIILIFISSVLLTTFTFTDYTDDSKKTVLFYGQNQLGSWDVPEYGKYGRLASGMFGMFPLYLNSSGYENRIIVENKTEFINYTQPEDENITRYINITDYLEIIEGKTITKDILEDVDIFVVINLNTSFSDQELNIIWDFVKNGGSLLVLGDHTDIDGIKDPLNNLTEPFGISYRFDSGLPISQNQDWETCYHFMHHPINLKIKDMHEIGISVGATLNIEGSAYPIIIGRYGLSDNGNYSNNQSAYLGDYKYNPGELIGEIVLVAGAYYDDGKVVVFGDTSTFQNPSQPYSYDFINSVFAWLGSEKTGSDEYIQIDIALVLLLAAIILYLISKKKISFILFPLALCIAILLSSAVNPMMIKDTEIKGNLVYIDTSHGERFNIEPYSDNSLSGLMLNLMRNNYLPLITSEFSKEKIKNSEIIIFNAPTKAFTNDEVNFLKQYIKDGGNVIICTGYEDKSASMPLLKEFYLDIYEIPLGPVPYVEDDPEKYQKEPRFVDSWPIYYEENTQTEDEPDPFYEITILGDEYILMKYVRYNESYEENGEIIKKYSKGGLLLIADSQFLTDSNIETLYDYWPGNIQFLKSILDGLKEEWI